MPDLLTGGQNTTVINVDEFYPNWMSSQRDNVYHPKVKFYADKISKKEKVEAPILGDIDCYKDAICIRTIDGRHRLAAAKLAGITVVYVRLSHQSQSQIEAIFSGIIKATDKKEVKLAPNQEDDQKEPLVKMIK